jgi:phosphoglycolate phosphatase
VADRYGFRRCSPEEIEALRAKGSREIVRALEIPAWKLPLIAAFESGSSMFGKAARIRRLLRRSGVPASEAMLIGDETRDVEAARKAGVASGAVTWGYTKPEAFEAIRPTAVFDSVAAMADFLAPTDRTGNAAARG